MLADLDRPKEFCSKFASIGQDDTLSALEKANMVLNTVREFNLKIHGELARLDRKIACLNEPDRPWNMERNVMSDSDNQPGLEPKASLDMVQNLNIFAEIEGWTDDNYDALSELGNIPIWGYQPVWRGEDLIIQPLPCKVKPVFRPVYEASPCLGSDGSLCSSQSISVSIKDFPLVCKALRYSNNLLAYEQKELTLYIKTPDKGLSPEFRGFSTNGEAETFFLRGVMCYLVDWILNARWETDTLTEQFLWGDHVLYDPDRDMTYLERLLCLQWEVLQGSYPMWNIHETVKQLFEQAEQTNGDEGIDGAIHLYVGLKGLIDRITRESPLLMFGLPGEAQDDFYKWHSFGSFRLSCMLNPIKAISHGGLPGPSLALKQWAYINTIEAQRLSKQENTHLGHPHDRANLAINKGALQMALPYYTQLGTVSSLCYANYLAMKNRFPSPEGDKDLWWHKALSHFVNKRGRTESRSLLTYNGYRFHPEDFPNDHYPQ